VKRTPVYRGRVIDVGVDTVTLPNGRTCDLEIIRHPGGAAVVALNTQMHVCLLRQYRHAAGGWLWELPAGRIDPGEQPLETAQRELAEEAGVQADGWEDLGAMFSSPGVFTERIHLYLARQLTETEQCTEEHEVLEVHWLPLRQALDWAISGEIRDAKTLVGLFRAAAREGVVSFSE